MFVPIYFPHLSQYCSHRKFILQGIPDKYTRHHLAAPKFVEISTAKVVQEHAGGAVTAIAVLGT